MVEYASPHYLQNVLLIGLGISAVAFSARTLVQTVKRARADPSFVLGWPSLKPKVQEGTESAPIIGTAWKGSVKSQYLGTFEQKMTPREAHLILGLKYIFMPLP